MKNILDYIPSTEHAAIANYTSTYDATADFNTAIAALGSGELHLPAGKYVLDDTLILPRGVSLVGEGRFDKWANVNVGTIIEGGAALTGQRWTDINGSDPADDTPLLVAGGNNVFLRNLTLLPGPNGRSAGFFVPCVKQCGTVGVSGFGFTDAALYLDATWSNRNNTLKALHPSINPDSGMNEFHADDCWYEGSGTAGFGIKVQGTTRAWNSVGSESAWLWGWGGTSDIRVDNTRLGSNAPNGGCYSHDAQLYGATAFGRGVTFDGVAFRASGGSKYAIKLDRTDGHHFISAYAEGKSGVDWEIAITSRTQSGPQGILFEGERMISGNVTLDGVIVSSISRRYWEQTRCLSFTRQRGELSLPNFGGGESNAWDDIPYISSFHDAGTIFICKDDGTAKAAFMRIDENRIRPESNDGMSLGDGNRRFSAAYAGRYQSGTVTIANNAAVSIPVEKNGGIMAILTCGGSEDSEYPDTARSGLVYFDVGASVRADKFAGGARLATVTTDVTGTTGAANDLTVGVKSNNVRIENRSGAEVVVRYTVLV